MAPRQKLVTFVQDKSCAIEIAYPKRSPGYFYMNNQIKKPACSKNHGPLSHALATGTDSRNSLPMKSLEPTIVTKGRMFLQNHVSVGKDNK